MNAFHVVNELLIAAFYSILLSKSTYLAHFKWEDISSKCITIVMIAWGMNMALSMYLSLSKIIRYFIEIIKKKKLSKVVNTESQINNTIDNIKKKNKFELFN